uniref:DNA-directed DNA polymerase n=1 Tax=Meloidogyne hapla TaxID=6305 RepID=A0A1I8B0R1_MELHA
MSQGSPPKKPRFLINEILDNEPRQQHEYRHPFFIRNLISNNNQEQNRIQIGTGEIENCIEKIDSIKTYCKRFKLFKLVTKFTIKAVTKNPEDVIRHILINCINQAVGRTWLTHWFSVTIHTLDVSALPKEKSIRGRAPSTTTSCTSQSVSDTNECWLIKIRNFNDNYCLFYALEFTKKYVIGELGHKRNFGKYHREQLQRQQTDMLNLMAGACIPLSEQSYDAHVHIPKVVDYWNKKYEQKGYKFKVFVFGDRCENTPKYVYGSDNFNTPIPIYYSKGHFDGIRTVGAQFGQHWQYCYSCQKKYRKAKEHNVSCKSLCRFCGRIGIGRPCPVYNNFKKECSDCGKIFSNSDCFEYHKSSNHCLRSKQCQRCGVIWRIKDFHKDPAKKHICGHKWCLKCMQYHSSERGCFIRPLEPKKKTPYRLLTFDFESTQHTKHPQNQNHRLHNVNFIAATITCTNCMENEQWKSPLKQQGKFCNICGKNRNITFSHRPFLNSQVDEQRVTDDPLHDFVKWILFELDKKFTTIAFSHFGGRYDMIMTFREIFVKGIVPSIIRRGNKLYELRVSKTQTSGEIIFRDSYNICPVALGQLVGAFDLQVQEKQFFPHLANNPKNYDITLPRLPPKSDYLYGEISKPKNCDNTSIGIDILQDAMTIASACMKHFRLNHLKEEHLAIVPEKGYDTCDNQSEIAMKYLDWYAEMNGVEIRTAHSEGGEYTVAGRYKVDGYIETEDRAIEVHGCVWHACPRHYGDRPDHVLPNGKTVEVVRREDDTRLEILREHIRHVDVVWECEIKEMLRRNRKMRKCFSKYLDKGPIKLRDCFFGGRTGPRCLHYEADEQHKISYLDFNSLYPSTIATTDFPTGHPKVKIIPRNEQDVNWTRSDQIPVNGILKIFLIPPLKTEIPVMPVKFDDRLLFPLCRQCSLDFPRGATIPDYTCQHGDKDRGWISTCTSIELGEALNNGYKVIKYFRALHYENWDSELFKGYVSEFMRMKIHASGFPKGIDTQLKEEKFIRECQEKFGIYIEKEKMVPDKAMRYISKLMLNSLWGRFSLRKYPNKESYHRFTSRTTKFCGEQINRSCSLLYGDTDSVLFSYPKDKESPLSSGYHLGELAEEYEDFNIKEYIGAACKAYALKMVEKETGKEKSMLKVRGITLTSDICKKLHYSTFKESVMDFGKIREENENQEISIDDDEVMILEYPNFIRPNIKTGTIISAPTYKKFKGYCDP